MPPEAVEALTSYLSFAVHTAVLLAQKRPEIFADEVSFFLANGEGEADFDSAPTLDGSHESAAVE